jgi:hypothetical protein
MIPDGSGVILNVHEQQMTGALRLLRWAPGKQLNTVWRAEVPGLVARSSESPYPLVIRAAPDGAAFVTLDAKPNRSHTES